MNNKILMLSQTVFPPDIRLEKEIKSLDKNGYKVLVLCNQFNKMKNPGFEYCEIERVKAVFNSTKLNKLINFPFFLNPRYLFASFKYIILYKPDYIHAHDLPMMPIAILFGKLFRIPIIFDMHENYPQALKQFNKKGFINLIFKNYRFALVLEKLCLKHSDRIIVVIDEGKERLISMNVPSGKITVVSNTVDLETFTIPESEPYNSSNALMSDKKIILYTGTFSAERGLKIPILAMKSLLTKINNVMLLLVGEGPQKQELKTIVENNQLENYVRFVEWVDHIELASVVNKAEVCIIPQPNNEFINTTIPHKLFEYMAIGKPVLVSDALPLKRIINETGAGLVFKSDDEINFALRIEQLLTKEKDWGARGLEAVKNIYNWKNDEKCLLNMYNNLN